MGESVDAGYVSKDSWIGGRMEGVDSLILYMTGP